MIILPVSMLVVFWGFLLFALAVMLGIIEFGKMRLSKEMPKQ
jgi:hypothetical protein